MTKLVVIDPGHGGHDSGATGHGLRECDVTLQISKRIKRTLLRDFDVDVKLTRSDDRFVGLDARAKFANDRNAAYFVAVHINSALKRRRQRLRGLRPQQRRHGDGVAAWRMHDAVAAYMRDTASRIAARSARTSRSCARPTWRRC